MKNISKYTLLAIALIVSIGSIYFYKYGGKDCCEKQESCCTTNDACCVGS